MIIEIMVICNMTTVIIEDGITAINTDTMNITVNDIIIGGTMVPGIAGNIIKEVIPT